MKKMTVLFEDEALYTAVKIEALRRGQPLKELVTRALREWLDDQEDAELLPAIDEARVEWREKGGVDAEEFFRNLRGSEKGGSDAA